MIFLLSAHRAADWAQFEAERDVLPNLEWMPSTSINPGEDHRTFWGTTLPIEHPFWEQHQPGDRWNCKCYLRSTDKEPTREPQATTSDLRHDGLEVNPAITGEVFTDNCAYVKSCNRKKKNLVQRYTGDKLLRKETQQALHEVQGKSISLKKLDENIDVLFDSKTTSHLSNDVARCSNFLWNEIIKDIKSVLKKSKLIAHEPNRKLDKKPSAVEYFYYEYKINGKSLFISVEENFVQNEYRHFYRLYAISNTLRDSVIFY